MKQTVLANEQPQFTDLATFALHLAQSAISWHDPQSGEDIFAYFQRRPPGDELSLRASLIREHILPAFNYTLSQIEYESRERFDLVLRSQNQQNRRRIAIIETKSSAIRNLATVRGRSETPLEQLERYLLQAGLYLGVLTNGDEWHLFDFALGCEPLASFSIVELAHLLQSAKDKEAVERRLQENLPLRQALTIIFYYLDARRWEQTDVFRENLANDAYFHIASLQKPQHVETLVQHIKQVLGSLRETIRAQFTLLQRRYEEYQQLCTYTNNADSRPFQETLQDAIENVGKFGTAFHMYDDGQLRGEILILLKDLSAQYLADGDIAAFESDYLQQARDILAKYQLSQISLVEKKVTRSVSLLPPINGLDDLKMLLQTHYIYIQSLNKEFELSIKTMRAYSAWKAGVRGIFRAPEDEFCLQTAYIHFVRLFFVRVCEDHALIVRRISDGPFSAYEEYRHKLLSGIKDAYQRLLEEAYQRASSVYHNFFGHHEFYDWFVLDEYNILALFDVLNHYDFHGLSADVLGRVYNEGYIEAKERSERGQFYTPPQVVDYMLDAVGIPAKDETNERKARAFLDKKVGDLSCGSGTFLVAAATRKSALLQRLVATDEITADHALQQLTETFLGFDLNPFACYLAEINLLIQCLPFLLNKEGKLCRSVTRFHIYSTDTLEPIISEQVRALLDGTATEHCRLLQQQRGRFISDDERAVTTIKDIKALPSELELLYNLRGIDYLLGNPPYVSAGESDENLRYRTAIWEFGVYHLLHQRWDLFVPFFERNLQFLRPNIGRLSLIVSDGIETAGYAEKLQQMLVTQYRILQIDFFPRLYLFQDARVHNTIVTIESGVPDEEHEVIRRKHLQADCQHFETLPPITQLDANGQLFRWRYDRTLDLNMIQGSVPLCAIVYIGTGVEAQSEESLDPIVTNKRQKLFMLDDVFLDPDKHTVPPPEYVDTGVLGNDVDRYYLRRTRYVAYEKYRPQMRRSRHIALFQTPEKLLLGETSGGYYDRGGLFANHSVQVVVLWSTLEVSRAVEEKGRLVLRRQPLTYLEAPDEPELLRYVELYLTQLHLELQKLSWAQARQQIQVPPTLEAVHEFMLTIDAIEIQKQQIRTTIATLLAQVEDLVETIYNEPADSGKTEIISKLREKNKGAELF